jgi:hypothetical protein
VCDMPVAANRVADGAPGLLFEVLRSRLRGIPFI